MTRPVQITFRDVEHTDALDAYIQKRADKLWEIWDRVTSCHVTLENPHHRGAPEWHVRVDVSVPGHEIVVNHGTDPDTADRDAYAAIDHAFDRARRQVEDRARKSHGE